jgi:hypothetical protein
MSQNHTYHKRIQGQTTVFIRIKSKVFGDVVLYVLNAKHVTSMVKKGRDNTISFMVVKIIEDTFQNCRDPPFWICILSLDIVFYFPDIAILKKRKKLKT